MKKYAFFVIKIVLALTNIMHKNDGNVQNPCER